MHRIPLAAPFFPALFLSFVSVVVLVELRFIDFFGMQYAIPMMTGQPGTVIAVNFGGAVIPARAL